MATNKNPQKPSTPEAEEAPLVEVEVDADRGANYTDAEPKSGADKVGREYED